MNAEDIVQPLEPVPIEESASGDGEPIKMTEAVVKPGLEQDEPTPAASR